MTATQQSIARQFAAQTHSESALSMSSTSMLLLLAAFAFNADAGTAPQIEPQHSLRITAGIESSQSTAVVATDTSMEALRDALQHLTQQLLASQTDIDPQDKEIIYANLWKLYD